MSWINNIIKFKKKTSIKKNIEILTRKLAILEYEVNRLSEMIENDNKK